MEHDGSQVATEIFVVLGLILLNGVFAMAEIALVSVRKARLEQRVQEGDSRARTALELLEAPERFLSTVQVGITLIGILTGAFSGATISEAVAERLRATFLAPYADSLALGVVVVIITYFSLVLGELLPKRLGISYAERVALAIAKPMRLLSMLGSPIVHVLTTSTRLGQRALGLHDAEEDVVTEDELRHLVREAETSGELEKTERHILERVFHLNDLKVTALMVPRKDVVWLDREAAPAENWRRVAESGYSAYLVCDKNIDTVVGEVRLVRLWEQRLRTGDNALDEVLETPLYFPESMSVLTAIEKMKRTDQTMAVILDEYGGTNGIITLGDLVANVFWGVRMNYLEAQEGPVQREDGSWLVPGVISMHDLHKLLGLNPIGEDESLPFDTLGGLLMTELGHIPTVGAEVTYNGHRLEVVDMDGLRVDQVLCTKLPAADAND